MSMYVCVVSSQVDHEDDAEHGGDAREHQHDAHQQLLEVAHLGARLTQTRPNTTQQQLGMYVCMGAVETCLSMSM